MTEQQQIEQPDLKTIVTDLKEQIEAMRVELDDVSSSIQTEAALHEIVREQLKDYPTVTDMDRQITSQLNEVQMSIKNGLADVKRSFEGMLSPIVQRQYELGKEVAHQVESVIDLKQQHERQQQTISTLVATQNRLAEDIPKILASLLGDGDKIGLVAKVSINQTDILKVGERLDVIYLTHRQTDNKIDEINAFVRTYNQQQAQRQELIKHMKESAFYVLSRALPAGVGTGLLALLAQLFGGG